jgi:superfamily II DNA or RNA helicase
MEDVIREAHGELMRIRDDEPDAGGLLIAMDQNHAKEAARLIEKVTGYSPVIAISEDEDASRRIVEFERGSSPWIVAVKMVSEGVDIPRLRVCVYATNVTSPLFFRQAIGRIVRRRNEEDTDAYFFIPKDGRLVVHALEVKHERDHVLREQREAVRREMGSDDEGPRVRPPIIAYDATARADGAIHDGVEYDQALIEQFAPIAKKLGIAAVKLAAAAEDLRALLESRTAEAPQPETPKASKDERKAQLRRLADNLAKRLAGILSTKTQRPYKDCIAYINKAALAAGHKKARQADEDGLRMRIEYLSAKLQEASDGSI